jgi:hypothetical protein
MIEAKIYNLIINGVIDFKDENEEDVAIDFLITSAQKHPEILLSVIAKAFTYDYIGMSIPALAAYLCNSDGNHFNDKIRFHIINLIESLDPAALLELVEYIKSKVFKGGLGSKNQKLIREVMERWSLDILKKYATSYPSELKTLLELIHPRFQGEKSFIIKTVTNKKV